MSCQDPGNDQLRHTLSRKDVAALLGISTSTVRRLEFDGLTPVQDGNGVWRFNRDEVLAIAPRFAQRRPGHGGTAALGVPSRLLHARKGRLAASVFRMFARHITLPQIVVATKQPPEVIRDLYREWSLGLDEGEWERRDRTRR
jgi:hypothetical protein